MEQDITSTAAYKAAEVYEQFFVPSIFRNWTPVLLERVSPQPGEQVLDVACGTGVVTRAVAPLIAPNGKVIGLDSNPAMLAFASKHNQEFLQLIEWREGKAESLPFPDETFDLVLCQQGLQFFKDRVSSAQEIHRVLKKRGRVGIEVWQGIESHPFYYKFYSEISSVLQVPLADLTPSYAFGDPQALENLLESVGFGEVQVAMLCLNALFAEPDRFVDLMYRAASAVIPSLSQLDSSKQNELRETVNQRIEGLIKDHTVAGVLTIPLYANISTATK